MSSSAILPFSSWTFLGEAVSMQTPMLTAVSTGNSNPPPRRASDCWSFVAAGAGLEHVHVSIGWFCSIGTFWRAVPVRYPRACSGTTALSPFSRTKNFSHTMSPSVMFGIPRLIDLHICSMKGRSVRENDEGGENGARKAG